MISWFKKFTVWLVLLVNITVWYGPLAHAGLKDTLTDLGGSVTTQSSGRFSSSARNVATMGGMSMRFSTRGASVTMISITPPSYSVGCGGISAWFGGFSFVTGKQVEQWIRTIAQGATAFVVKMAIKALCPICEAVLATVEKLAQFAAKLSMDGCAAGQALASMAEKAFSDSTKDKTRSVCGREVAKGGKSSDLLDAMDSFCNDIGKADKQLTEAKNKLFNKNDPAGELAYEQGNQTWLILRAMNLAGPEALPSDTTAPNTRGWHGYLLMNLVGAYTQGDGITEAVCKDSKGSTVTGDGTSATGTATETGKASGCYYAPKLSGSALWGALMCGDSAKSSIPSSIAGLDSGSMNVVKQDQKTGELSKTTKTMSSAVYEQLQDYCKGLGTDNVSMDSTLWVCDGTQESDGATNARFPLKCINMTEKSFADLRKELLGSNADNGYVLYVYELLLGGVQSVAAGEALKPELIALLDRTPYPIYQLLTASAVYPDAALASMASLSLIIGQSLVTDEIRQLNNAIGKSGVVRTAKGTEMTMRIMEALKAINDHNVNVTRTINIEADLQTKMYTQIRDLNRRMQQSVLGPNLLANEKMATTLTSRAINLSKANSAPKEAAPLPSDGTDTP